MSTTCVYSPILCALSHPLTPWQAFMGGPGLPEKPLYSPDSQFGVPDNVVIDYDSNDILKNVVAKVGMAEASASFDFIVDNGIKKLVCMLQKNSVTELTITEWFDGSKGFLEVRRPNYSSYNIDINVAAVNGETAEFDTEILFNNIVYSETVKAGDIEIPSIVKDFAKAISAMQSNLTIAAFDTKLIGVLLMESYKKTTELQYRNIIHHVINTLIAMIAGAFGGFWVAVLVHTISMLIIAEELY